MATYFTSTTGNDNNSGNQSFPFLTIARGLQSVVTGDTLYIRGGAYSEEINNQTQVVASGTSWSNPVTISSFSTEIVTLNGGGRLNLNGYGSTIAQYIIFNGLILDGQTTGDTGVFFGGPLVHHIRLQNSEVRNYFHQGIQGYDNTNIELINVKSHHNGIDRLKHGLYMAVQNLLIDGCEFYSNSGYGIQLYHQSGTNLELNGGIVRNTRVYNNLGDGGVTINNTSNFLFCNNLVYNNVGEGVGVCYNGVNSVRIFNNTFYGNGGNAINICAGVPGTSIQNNIIYNNSGAINDVSGLSFQNKNLINQNPFFVNQSSLDFHLTATSQAVNAGATLIEVTTDFDGTTRPQGSGYDIGAYEFVIFIPSLSITCDDSLPWTLISSGVFINNSLLKTVNFSIKPARWICFRAISEVNGNPWASCAELSVLVNGVSLLPKSSWTIWCFDSQEVGSGNLASRCIDEDINTFWHTQFITGTPGYPHNLVIDLGRPYPLNGFTYLPRQDGGINGTVARYEFYISDYFIPSGRVMQLSMMQPFLAM